MKKRRAPVKAKTKKVKRKVVKPTQRKAIAVKKGAAAKSTSITKHRRPAKRSGHAPLKVRLADQRLLRLQEQLREATETLDAIRNGEVDAVVVNGLQGTQIYTLVGADQPYRVYIEQMKEGAITIGRDGLILYTNQRFAEMINMPLTRVISTSIQNYLPGDVWQKLVTVFEQGGDLVVKHECSLTCAMALPVYLTGSRLTLPDQDVLCLIVTDLTQQKESNSLRLAKELAEKSNMAKDNFLAALSHELRTPLTPALMAAVALEEDPELPPRFKQELSLIRRNVELEARLIDDLLDLTRIARGKLELHPASTDVHAVLQRAIDICQADIRAKGLNFSAHFEASSYLTLGDPVRLQQVFWNLIRNAVKFTPPGGSIQIATDNPVPEEFRLQIVDNGVGFEPEMTEQIFAAFEQGGRQITREFGGLGLGLAICRSIMHGHRGTIDGFSAGPNRGATFTIRLPLRPAQLSHPTNPSNSTNPANTEAALRILLVEDHPDTRASMAKLLRRKHDVQTADSAAEALALAMKHSFDLVISDLGLPDRGGLELMRQLRDNHRLKGICISGYGMEEDISSSREAGFVHHLTKPISFERLQHAISTIIDENI
jgi:signal transduction histidine kinase